MSGWRTIRVPASSANLGPGFDALGLALAIYLECRYRSAASLAIRVSGCGAGQIPQDAENLIWRIAQQTGATPVELEIHNSIPLGKGLGSSAAAVIAGLAIGSDIVGLRWNRTRILDEAARIEGHPDNVAASVLGGLVAAATDCSGSVRAVRHDLHPACRVAVIVPDFELPTEQSRTVLPASYSRADAIFNIQRTALLVSALTTGATGALPAALDDRIHQPYRFQLVPGLERITRLRLPGLFGCALSGAGPSVLVFFEPGSEHVCREVQAIWTGSGRAAEILYPGVPADGYQVL